MRPGARTRDHWFVGHRWRLKGSDRTGVCVSVTPWGSNRIRWVRLRFSSGAEKSYAPSHLRLIRPPRDD